MAYVALVKTAVLSPFMPYLVEGGADLRRLQQLAGIRSGLMDDAEASLTLHGAGGFLEEIARREGLTGFGAEVGARRRIDSLVGFGVMPPSSLTLESGRFSDRFE